jgi:acetyl-CoA synthetase
VAFVVLKPGYEPTEDLRSALVARVTAELGKPLKPREIRFAATLPKTRNAKVMRRVIRATYLGEDSGDLSSLEEMSSLEAIRNAI